MIVPKGSVVDVSFHVVLAEDVPDDAQLRKDISDAIRNLFVDSRTVSKVVEKRLPRRRWWQR